MPVPGRRAPSNRRRLHTLEALEESASTVGPTVTGVQVASTQWTAAYFSYLKSHGLGNQGYSVPVGSSVQAKTLPWNNLNQVKISFNKDVNIAASNLSITGVNSPLIAVSDFFDDAFTHIATWTLAQPLPANVYQLDLDGDMPIRSPTCRAMRSTGNGRTARASTHLATARQAATSSSPFAPCRETSIKATMSNTLTTMHPTCARA